MNKNSLKSVKAKKSTPEFLHDYDLYWLSNLVNPENAIAYNENFIKNTI